MSTNLPCYHCSNSIDISYNHPLGFRETCAGCGRDAHVCLNCELYDPGAHHECRESSAEWVRDKERANRCEYFKPGSRPSGSAPSKSSTLSALDDLFNKK